MPKKSAIYTIGHSTRPLDEFIDILKGYSVKILIDVRTIPRSRTNPQFNKDSLPVPLEEARIHYRHIAELGGLRARQKNMGESPNMFWENKSFRNYADYAMTEDFHRGLKKLEEADDEGRCAIMCAELLWWRCHRRIIADYLVAEGYPVFHIMSADKAEPAKITAGAEIRNDETIVYNSAAASQENG